MFIKGQIALQNLFFGTNCYDILSRGNSSREKLYNIWSKSAKIKNDEYKVPEGCFSDIEDLQRTGYVHCNKYSFKITPKGAVALKEVILNNDKSSFEE